jgi:hypothetical protein
MIMVHEKKLYWGAVIFLIFTSVIHPTVMQEKQGITILFDDFRDQATIIPLGLSKDTVTAQQLLSAQFMIQPLSITVHNNTQMPLILQSSSLQHLSINTVKTEGIKKLFAVPDLEKGRYFFACLYPVLLFGMFEGLMWKDRTLRYPITVPLSLLAYIVGWQYVRNLTLHYNRTAIEYQKQIVDDLFLTDTSGVVIAPGTRARVIALVDSENYWGNCVVQLFDESGTQVVVSFDIDANAAAQKSRR